MLKLLHFTHRDLANLALGNLLEAEDDFAEALRTAPSHAHYPHYRAVVHGRKVGCVCRNDIALISLYVLFTTACGQQLCFG